MPQITCLLDLYHHIFGLRPSHIYANMYVSLLFQEWLHHKRLLLEVCHLPLVYCINHMSNWWFLKLATPPKKWLSKNDSCKGWKLGGYPDIVRDHEWLITTRAFPPRASWAATTRFSRPRCAIDRCLLRRGGRSYVQQWHGWFKPTS